MLSSSLYKMPDMRRGMEFNLDTDSKKKLLCQTLGVGSIPMYSVTVAQESRKGRKKPYLVCAHKSIGRLSDFYSGDLSSNLSGRTKFKSL